MGAGGKSYQEQKKKRSEMTKLKTAFRNTEKEIETLEMEIEELHEKLSDPEISTDYERITELTNLLAEKDEALTTAMEKWESLAEQIEE